MTDRITKGFELLNKFFEDNPNWKKSIDFDKFDMFDLEHGNDILSMLFGDFMEAVWMLDRFLHTQVNIINYGLTYREDDDRITFNNEWKRFLLK